MCGSQWDGLLTRFSGDYVSDLESSVSCAELEILPWVGLGQRNSMTNI